MSRWSSLRLSFTLFSLLCISRAQISTDCPTVIRSYNASGLLGFFDSLANGPVPSETFDPIVDNNGYLYHTDDSSPAPPATFAYSRIVSEATVPSDNGTFPAIITTLLGTVPLNRTENITHIAHNSSVPSAVSCSLALLNLPLRTTRFGQDDDGTCTSTLPHSCGKKILNNVVQQGMQWPRGDTDLPGICSAYAKALSVALNQNSLEDTDIPRECTKLFLDEDDKFIVEVKGSALSNTNVSQSLNPDMPYECDGLNIVSDTLGKNYKTSYPIWNQTVVHDGSSMDTLDAQYDEVVRQVLPLVTLVLRGRGEDTGAEKDVEVLSAHLGCVRTTGFSAGSRKSAELKDLDAGGRLSKGAIAGIVIGVLVGVAAIVAFALLYWGARRRGLAKGERYEMRGKYSNKIR